MSTLYSPGPSKLNAFGFSFILRMFLVILKLQIQLLKALLSCKYCNTYIIYIIFLLNLFLNVVYICYSNYFYIKHFKLTWNKYKPNNTKSQLEKNLNYHICKKPILKIQTLFIPYIMVLFLVQRNSKNNLVKKPL